jgi:hypothetical protein
MAKEIRLRMRLANKKPIELVDLGQSFRALGEQYQDYVTRVAGAGEGKLYVVRMQQRSPLIADFKGFLDQASFVVDHIDIIAGFITNLNELINYFRSLGPIEQEPTAPTRAEAERLAKIVEPVAKDGGSQLNIAVQGDVHMHVTINLDSERANAIQNNVRRFVGKPVPETGSFEREVLYLEQMRGNRSSSVGDRGIIENFSSRPVKLHFMSEEVKAAILEKPQNPFLMDYVVDGVASYARGQPALYKITRVHEAIGPAKAARANRPRRRKKAA